MEYNIYNYLFIYKIFHYDKALYHCIYVDMLENEIKIFKNTFFLNTIFIM